MTMERQEMKRTLRKFAKPVKKELFDEVGFTEEEIALMKYLYIDRVGQGWAADELGISIPTLTKIHNDCIDQVISFYNFEEFKQKHNEINCFNKYFV